MAVINQAKEYWAISPSETLADLITSEEGLSIEEAEERLKLGQNIIKRSWRTGRFRILANQFKSSLILILVFAALVTAFLGDYKDMIFIVVAIIINATLGFYQENKAERALAELKRGAGQQFDPELVTVFTGLIEN